jgi:hypothetical protein
MMTIWKLTLGAAGDQVFRLPRGAKFLCVKTQHDVLSLWFMFDLANRDMLEPREIRIYGTAHHIADEKLVYIGTALLFHDDLVLHVFEAKP